MEKRLHETPERRHFQMRGKGGFTLVELVVVVAIVAILATVATPSYINYVNRTRQGNAAAMLLTARLEMEEFYTDNGRYANTIQCLPSFASGKTLCTANSSTSQNYTFWVSQVTPAGGNTQAYYQISATRKIYSWAPVDLLTVSAATNTPTVVNTQALHFSVFRWLFQ
jgi:type IV pilus assembly protein PilE